MATATRTQAVPSVQSNVGVRILIGIILSAMTSVMMILAFPPANVWPLAFVCMIPMLVARYRVLPLKWAWIAPVVGTDVWVLWLVTTLFGFNPDAWFIYLIPVVVAVGDYASAKGGRLFHESTSYRFLVLEGVFSCVGFEMIRRFVPFVRTHGLMGHMLHTQPWLIQPVSIFSVYGLSLLVVFTNYALAQGAFVLVARKWQWEALPALGKRLVRGWLIGVGIAFVVWVGISLVILASAPKDPEMVRVAAVQSGHTGPSHWPLDQPQEGRLANLTEHTRIAAQQGAQFVVWPELAIGIDPHVAYTEELRALAAETGATIVIGYGLGGDRGPRNAAVPLTPSGEFLDIYGKSHTPPGERRDPDAGKYPVYDTELGRWGIIICHDTNFTDSSRIVAQKGARLLAIPTLETYITGLEKLFYIQMVFRSVENRIPTVKADGAFSSSIIDPYGRIVALKSGAPDGEAFALVGDVPLVESGTLYTRVGDWMGWLSIAGMAVFMVLPGILKKRQGKRDAAES